MINQTNSFSVDFNWKLDIMVINGHLWPFVVIKLFDGSLMKISWQLAVGSWQGIRIAEGFRCGKMSFIVINCHLWSLSCLTGV